MSGETTGGSKAAIKQAIGDAISEIFYEESKLTWANRTGRFGEVAEYGEGFSSFRGMPMDSIGAKGLILSASADGIGSKVEVAERMRDHRTIAYDLIAMSCDDAVIRGGEPFSVNTVFDANRLRGIPDLPNTIRQIARGSVEAAQLAEVAITNGETAELVKRILGYGPFNYNWSSTASWLVNRERIIDNTAIRPGDALVGFRDNGLRSNGFTDAQLAFETGFGEAWHEEKVPVDGEQRKLGELALEPSVIYTSAMVDLTGGYDLAREPKAEIHGASHNTGGGIPEKLGRTLRGTGFGAEITDPFEPPLVAIVAQTFHPGRISDEMAYRLWHMGQGMIVITPEPDRVIAVAGMHDIQAKTIGEITEKPGIRINSAGIHSKPGKTLSYPAP